MATKKKTKEPAASGDLVTVRVLEAGGIHEDGAYHPKGSTYQTTAERAASLPTLVEIVEGGDE